jgi:hypothetical protein
MFETHEHACAPGSDVLVQLRDDLDTWRRRAVIEAGLRFLYTFPTNMLYQLGHANLAPLAARTSFGELAQMTDGWAMSGGPDWLRRAHGAINREITRVAFQYDMSVTWLQ